MSSRRPNKKSQPLWLRSALVVALIVVTCSLQLLSDALDPDTGNTETSAANTLDSLLSDPNLLASGEPRSPNLAQTSSQKTAPADLATKPALEHFEVGDIIFAMSRDQSDRPPQRSVQPLTTQPKNQPLTQSTLLSTYDRVAIVTTKSEQPSVVYSSLSAESAMHEEVAVNKARLSDYLDQMDAADLVVYRLSVTPPEMNAVVADAANKYYQQSLAVQQSVHCSQLIRSVYSAVEAFSESSDGDVCLNVEQLATDVRWQQVDLSKPVRAVQSSLD